MKHTITVTLKNRFNDAERIIGMFSSTGLTIEKMLLGNGSDDDLARLVIVADAEKKRINNLVIRLRQQVRVTEVECREDDHLPDVNIAMPYVSNGRNKNDHIQGDK